MKLFTQLIIAIVITAALTYWSQTNDSRIYLVFGSWQIGVSAILLALVVFVLWLLLNWVLGLIRGSKKWLTDTRHRRAIGKERRLRNNLDRAFILLLRGEWGQAERLLVPMRRKDLPLLSYLAAAYAAHMRDDSTHSHRHLLSARQHFPEQESSIAMMEASLCHQRGEEQQCVRLLEKLLEQDPNNRQALTWLYQLSKESGERSDQERLLVLMPRLSRLGIIDKKAYRSLLGRRKIQELRGVRENDLIPSWHAMTPEQRRDPASVRVYAARLIEQGQHPRAEKILRHALDRSLDSHLLALYGDLEEMDSLALIKNAHKWLKRDPENAHVLKLLAVLNYKRSLWGEAQNYAKRAAEVSTDPTMMVFYAKLEEKMGHPESALALYKKALSGMQQSEVSTVQVLEQARRASEPVSGSHPDPSASMLSHEPQHKERDSVEDKHQPKTA